MSEEKITTEQDLRTVEELTPDEMQQLAGGVQEQGAKHSNSEEIKKGG